MLAQAVPQQSHEHLSARVNAQTLPPKSESRTVAERSRRRQFTQQGLAERQRHAGIATGHWVAHPVALGGVEKQHLIGLSYGLILTQMTHVDAAIRKYQFGRDRVLFPTVTGRAASAVHIPDRNGRR